MNEVEVPRWAAQARSVCRGAVAVFGAIALLRLLMRAFDGVFNTSVFDIDWPLAVGVFLVAVMATVLISGVVWLAGAVVSGYREPKTR